MRLLQSIQCQQTLLPGFQSLALAHQKFNSSTCKDRLQVSNQDLSSEANEKLEVIKKKIKKETKNTSFLQNKYSMASL